MQYGEERRRGLRCGGDGGAGDEKAKGERRGYDSMDKINKEKRVRTCL